MKTKVIRYHNYPKVMEAEFRVNNNPSDLFYFCFFELNNGKKICLHTYETYNKIKDIYEWNTFMTQNKKGEDIDLGEYSVSYANDYVFGEDFFEWFDRSHIPASHVSGYPTKNEYACVIDYFENNIKR